jgi:hypothetical protein
LPALYPCRSKPNDLASRILPAPLRALSCILRDRTFSFCAHQAVQETFAAQVQELGMLRENPLAVGALGVGVGAAVGLAIPETAKEHEVMGEARDTFVEKAREKAQATQERVQQVAQEAQSAAQQEAEN